MGHPSCHPHLLGQARLLVVGKRLPLRQLAVHRALQAGGQQAAVASVRQVERAGCAVLDPLGRRQQINIGTARAGHNNPNKPCCLNYRCCLYFCLLLPFLPLLLRACVESMRARVSASWLRVSASCCSTWSLADSAATSFSSSSLVLWRR